MQCNNISVGYGLESLFSYCPLTNFFNIEQPICYPGQIIFVDNTTGYNESFYHAGYPTVCYNDTLVPICDTTDLNGIDISSICLQTTGVLGKQLACITCFVLAYMLRECQGCDNLVATLPEL